MSTHGIDIAGVEDVDLFLSYAEPTRSTAEAVMRSLLHAPGKLWWAPDVGLNLTQFLHAFFDADRTQQAVQAQCELDERVKSADVAATSLGGELRLSINLLLVKDDTKVLLTLAIGQLGEVLNATIVT